MTTFAEIATPFAESLCAKRRLLTRGDLSARQTSRVRDALSDDLKKLCDVLVPEVKRPKASVAALGAAREIGVDLCRQSWHGQPRFDRGRVVFHLEHVVPIKSL